MDNKKYEWRSGSVRPMTFDKKLTITLEFTPGTLLMREEYVMNMLYRSMQDAFRKAQKDYLADDKNCPMITVTVGLEPER